MRARRWVCKLLQSSRGVVSQPGPTGQAVEPGGDREILFICFICFKYGAHRNCPME